MKALLIIAAIFAALLLPVFIAIALIVDAFLPPIVVRLFSAARARVSRSPSRRSHLSLRAPPAIA